MFSHTVYRSTFFTKGETCAGGKRSKERITVGLCASATGEKLPPIVIGKANKPRCFKKITRDQLPVRYYANKKAWMLSGVMEDWLKWVDRRMRRERRHILLFVDNAPSHPKIKLDNVKLQFLPPNTTSVIQPMDQGIIQTMKLKYRKYQLQHVNSELARNSSITGPQILRNIDVLHAIYWTHSAWDDTLPETINKCFKRCGFLRVETDGVTTSNGASTSDDDDNEDDDVPLVMHILAKQLFDCELRELVNIDREFVTCDTDMSDCDRCATDILKDATPIEDSDDDDDETQQEEDVPSVDLNRACEMSSQLQSWALSKGHSDVLNWVMKLQGSLNVLRMDGCSMKQKSILEFFSEGSR